MDEKQRKRFEFWKLAADEEMNAASVLLTNKKLRQSLFFIHLSLEKSLKALFIKEKGEHPPITHNLIYIAEKIPLTLPPNYEKFLIEATAFNIESRYPDEESPPLDYQYVDDKYNAALEILKWIQNKSEE